MRMCSIASGSSGNCVYVGSESTHLLVDAGISGKKITEGVEALGVSMHDIDGILITHEHNDHVNGLGVLARKYEIPIYATAGTIRAIRNMGSLGAIDGALFQTVRQQEKFTVKDIMVNTLPISHDAAEPVAYKFACDGKRMAVVTDLGTYDEVTTASLQQMDAILMEANHDIRMLEAGPYPYPLKRRILGDSGHLCNEASGQLLCALLHDHMKTIMLGHLSRENNLPELAYETVRLEITNGDNPYRADDFQILVANRSERSKVIEV